MNKQLLTLLTFIFSLGAHSSISAATITLDPTVSWSNYDFLYVTSLDDYQITVSEDSIMTMVGLYDTHAPFDMEFDLLLDGVIAVWTRHTTGTDLVHFIGERDDLFLSAGTHNISFAGSTISSNLVGISFSTVQRASVPEPSTLFLLGGSLAGFGFMGWRRKS